MRCVVSCRVNFSSIVFSSSSFLFLFLFCLFFSGAKSTRTDQTKNNEEKKKRRERTKRKYIYKLEHIHPPIHTHTHTYPFHKDCSSTILWCIEYLPLGPSESTRLTQRGKEVRTQTKTMRCHSDRQSTHTPVTSPSRRSTLGHSLPLLLLLLQSSLERFRHQHKASYLTSEHRAKLIYELK